MILKTRSISSVKCWSNFWPISWTWFSVLRKSVACFGHTERSWCFFGINSKGWAKNKYDSYSWNNNI